MSDRQTQEFSESGRFFHAQKLQHSLCNRKPCWALVALVHHAFISLLSNDRKRKGWEEREKCTVNSCCLAVLANLWVILLRKLFHTHHHAPITLEWFCFRNRSTHVPPCAHAGSQWSLRLQRVSSTCDVIVSARNEEVTSIKLSWLDIIRLDMFIYYIIYLSIWLFILLSELLYSL